MVKMKDFIISPLHGIIVIIFMERVIKTKILILI